MGNHLHQHTLEVTKVVLVRVLVLVEITDRGQDLHMVEITDRGQDLHMVQITCMGVLASILAQVKDNKGTGRYNSIGNMTFTGTMKLISVLLLSINHILAHLW
jgi:hypothetical protein